MAFDQKTKFIGAIAIQLIAIFSIILFKLVILGSGTEILLHVQPVDPRDYLRGDSVIFQYDISSINSYNFNYTPIKSGDLVYVPLVKAGQYWVNSGMVTKNKPKNGNVYIKGTVLNGNSNGWSSVSKITLKYDIEQYWIPVNSGVNFSFLNHDVAASVQVGDNGEAVLKKIYVDGKEWPGKSQ